MFFRRDPLPGVMRVISDGLALTAAVELIRPLFLGQWPAQALHPLAVLTGVGDGRIAGRAGVDVPAFF